MGKGKAHTEEQIEEVISLYLLGTPVNEIAKRLGVGRSSIWVYLRQKGVIPTNQQRTRIFNQREENIRNWYEQGRSARNIAKELGVATSTITQVLKDAGMVLGGKKGRPKITDKLSQEDVNKIIDLYNKGEAISKISKLMGLSNDVISKYLRIWGVPKKKIPRYRKYVSHEQEASICDLYLKGVSVEGLANSCNLSQSTIKSILKNKGLKVSVKSANSYANRKKLSFQQEQELIASYEKGKNMLDITQEFGVSQYTVVRILKANSVSLKRKRKMEL